MADQPTANRNPLFWTDPGDVAGRLAAHRTERHDVATIGERIKAARLMAGLTRFALAHALEYGSETSVKRWERDESYPHTKDMPALAHALGVTVGYLMEGS
jgi:ribosome-binding protein aMBF1 (putative translation factor)